MTIRIVPMSPAELSATAALHEATFKEIGATESGFRRTSEIGGSEIWVALEENLVVGYSVIQMRPRGLYWNWFGVLPERRNAGVGTALLNKIMERAANEGAQVIELDSRNRYVDALRFYLKHGFQIVGTYLQDDGELMIKLKYRFAAPAVGSQSP